MLSRMPSRALPLFPAWLLFAAACTDEPRSDAGVSDLGADAAVSGPDAGAPEDAGRHLDARIEDGAVVITAVAGARCAPEERAGLVELMDNGNGALWANATLDDRPPPWLGPPLLTDSSCVFHDVRPGSSCACGPDQVCAFDGSCTGPPRPAEDLQLVLRAGQDEQVFSAPSPGAAGGAVTLPGRTFAVELHGLGLVVRVADTTVPEMLSGLSGALSGTYDAPVAVDITWDAPVGASQVFTHIPINHHVARATFTECVVDATSRALHVDRPMLEPLAVATGLEFQGVLHVRFAAATTSLGCVEVRAFTPHYLSLF